MEGLIKGVFSIIQEFNHPMAALFKLLCVEVWSGLTSTQQVHFTGKSRGGFAMIALYSI
jgi:hypothetical protein